MKKIILSACAAIALASCAAKAPISADEFPVTRPEIALRTYYQTLKDIELPEAPPSPALDKAQPVTGIVVGSCIDEEIAAPALGPMAAEQAQITLLIGDNVYGDMDGRFYENDDPNLKELRRAYADLAKLDGFAELRASRPMMTVWDDHDYGKNDGGGDFPFKEFAEDIYETFWGLKETDVAARPGVYDSVIAGPEGQRLQLIMLDTRFFRTSLTRTDEYGAPGKQRYLPSSDPYQSMLGEDQWAWLKKELAKPADLRLLVSSIQITPNVHGWEAWSTMPQERTRLYTLLNDAGVVDETIFISGDRHTAFLYKNTEIENGPVAELTASSVNKSFAKQEDSPEVDAMQVDKGFALTNYGTVHIDWDARQIALRIKNEEGQTRRELVQPF